MDFRNGFVMLCYGDHVSSRIGHRQFNCFLEAPYNSKCNQHLCFYDQDKLKPGYLKNLPVVLKQLSDFLGERKWLAGDEVLFIG